MNQPSDTRSRAIFELLMPFAESSDARLRGNAAHAYAALAEAPDPLVSERAREQLVSIVGSTPTVVGDASPDWERRFNAKVLDAYAGLSPAAAGACRKAVLDRSSDSASMQQRAFARFFMTLNTHSGANRNAVGWFRAQRLMWKAGRPGVGKTLLAVAWRWFVVLCMYWLPFYVFTGTNFINEPIFNVCVLLGLLATIVLMLLYLPGHFWQSRLTKAIDIGLAGLIVGAATVLAVVGLDKAPPLTRTDLVVTGVVGLMTGILVAWRRWLRRGARSDVLQSVTRWEPLIALCAITLLCLGAARLPGTSELRVGVAWGMLAPTVMLLAWVHEWAAWQPPRPLVPETGRRVNAWLVIVSALSIVVLAMVFAYSNISRALPEGRASAESKAIEIPGGAGKQNDVSMPVVMGIQHSYNVTQPGNVRFTAMPASGDQPLELHVTTPMEVADPMPERSSANAPAVIETASPAGVWKVCISPVDKPICNAPRLPHNPTESFQEFVHALMGRPTLEVAIPKLRPTLKVAYLPRRHDDDQAPVPDNAASGTARGK